MKRKNRTLQRRQKDKAMNLFLLKIALVAVMTALIVYFMPRTGGFNYSYELGQPWRYGTVISEHKFNIEMSDSLLALQRDSLARHFMPYYTRHTDVEASVKAAVMNLDEGDMTLKRHVVQMLDTAYRRGVMSGADRDSLRQAGTSYVRIIVGNEAQVVPLNRVMSTHEAYQYITHADTKYSPTAISRMNINTVLRENLTYDANKSTSEMEAEAEALSTSMGFVRVNEKIVDRGELVTEDIYQKLRSYETIVNRTAQESGTSKLMLWGQVGLVAIIVTLLITYLSVFRVNYLENLRSAILLFSLVALFQIMASVMVSHHILHVYILPYCMVPIIIRVFMDSRTAFTFHVGMILLISLSLSQPFEFALYNIITGLVVVLNLRELTQRSQIIHTSIVATLAYCTLYICHEFSIGAEVADLERSIFIYFCISGLLLLFTYPLFWVMEKVFGFVSDVTLVELSNINHPLLQKMSEEAPGTFQHSMQVANLATEVAKRIHAKSQLVRTGALYHDIGKMERPVFFTENQAGGNPHKHLSPMKSAEVIIAHVERGIALADKYNLPEQIKGFIRTHHGTGKTMYFLVTYKNEHPDEAVDETLFQYPGPNPSTKEEAILMMADTVEAASRSLGEYTEEAIGNLVDKLVDSQVSEGFFKQCPITFKDISDAKEVMKERLRIMYHTRISYPELNKNTDEDNKTEKK